MEGMQHRSDGGTAARRRRDGAAGKRLTEREWETDSGEKKGATWTLEESAQNGKHRRRSAAKR